MSAWARRVAPWMQDGFELTLHELLHKEDSDLLVRPLSLALPRLRTASCSTVPRQGRLLPRVGLRFAPVCSAVHARRTCTM